MLLFDQLILNTILSLFPLLIYLFYVSYKKFTNNKVNKIFFVLTNVSSIYLIMRYGNFDINNNSILFFNIPIIVSYLKKEKLFGILLSLFVIGMVYFVFDYNVIVLFVKYLCYFILSLYCSKKKIDKKSFILNVAIIQGFFIQFEYIYVYNNSTLYEIIYLFMIMMLFYAVSFFVIYLLDMGEAIMGLNNGMLELEKERELKNSIFKITHEIKNPIAVCSGYLEMFNIDNREKSIKYINIIKEEIGRTLMILQDFLELTKISVKKEVMDFNILMDDVLETVLFLVGDKDINFKYKKTREEIIIDGDYNRLKQVFINLIKNSIEAFIDTGIIEITLRENKDHIRINVIDNGPGISKENIERMKDMFYTTKKNGTGIGVHFSNEIIKLHGGSMEYKSLLGKGTTVIIKLPRKKARLISHA